MEKFYKLIYDITCFYIFTSFFFCLVFHEETNMMAYAVLLLTILLHVFSERMPFGKVPGLLVLVLPVICLFTEDSIAAKIQFVLPWFFFIFVAIRDQYSLYYEEFKSRFKGMIIVLPVLFLFAFGFVEEAEHGKAVIAQVVPFVLVFLASGVLLLQNLRFSMEGTGRKSFERHQLVQTVVFFLFCMLITAGRLLELLCEHVLYPLFEYIGGSALILVYLLYEKIMLMNLRFQAEKASPIQQGKIPQATPTLEPEAVSKFEEEILRDSVVQEVVIDKTLIVVCVAVLVAIVLFVVLLGSRKGKTKAALIEDEREVLEEAEAPAQKLKKRSIHPSIVIRYYYLRFIELANSGKVKVKRSDTTEEIREKFLLGKSEKREETKELTELYQKVRYTKENVTKEDAARMKVLMKRISV